MSQPGRPPRRDASARGEYRARGDYGGRGAPEGHAGHADAPYPSLPGPPLPGPFAAHAGTFAALDLGTNNCRLLVARAGAQGFTIIDAFSRIVRLGEGLASSGRIGEDAMQRAIGALRICADKLSRRRVQLSRSVATEACRRAENGAEFVDRVWRETGIRLDIITPQEEARLAMLGCHQLLEEGDGPALIFDIGGGSTEVVLLDDSGAEPTVLDWGSVPWGVVSLTESVPHDTEDAAALADAYAQMRARAAEALAPIAARLSAAAGRGGALRLLGTSGTVTTLASLHLRLPSYDRALVDGQRIAATEMTALCTMLANTPLSARVQLPCIGRERADLVVAGCALLEEVLAFWPAERVGIADRGIREGVLRLLVGSGQAPAHAGRQRTAA